MTSPQAATHAFDRETDREVPEEHLKSYRAALAQYHLHPEAKFLNGSYTDRGTTVRRLVYVDQIHAIGKEANRLEEQSYLGISDKASVAYSTGDAPKSLASELRALQDTLGQRELAFRIGIARATLSRLINHGVTHLHKDKSETVTLERANLKAHICQMRQVIVQHILVMG